MYETVYVNQHKNCQITFWPASVALPRYIIDDMWSYQSPLSGWLLFVVFICQFVADVGCLSYIVYALVHDNICVIRRILWQITLTRNYAVCKSLHFNYPQRLIVVCILPQNETNYTCERSYQSYVFCLKLWQITCILTFVRIVHLYLRSNQSDSEESEAVVAVCCWWCR